MNNPKVTKKRVFNVVHSCRTIEQLRGAINYSILAGMRQDATIDELIQFKILTLNK